MLIRRVAGPNAKTQRNPHYRAQVCVYNTDKRLMDALVDSTGIDRVYAHTRQPKEHHKKTSYRWNMVADDVRKWGPQLLPWLVCKREQMELLLEALQIADGNTPRTGEPLVYSGLQRRDEIYAEIRRLNTKGRETTKAGDAE